VSPQISCAVVWVFLQQWLIKCVNSRPPQCFQDCDVFCYYCPSQNACQYFLQPSGRSVNSDNKLDQAPSGVNERILDTDLLASHVSFGSGPWHLPAALVRIAWRQFLSHLSVCLLVPKYCVVFVFFFFNKMTGYNEMTVWTSCLVICPSTFILGKYLTRL